MTTAQKLAQQVLYLHRERPSHVGVNLCAQCREEWPCAAFLLAEEVK